MTRTYKEAIKEVLKTDIVKRLQNNQDVIMDGVFLIAAYPDKVTADDLEHIANHYGDNALIMRMIAEKMRDE